MSSPWNIILKSSEGTEFEVSEEVAMESQLLKDMIDDGCHSGLPIPLPNVKAKILESVIRYCVKHVQNPNLGDRSFFPAITELHKWDKEFVNVDVNTLQELLKAANYLNIKGLFDLIASAFADIIKDMTVQEIRRFFGIKNNFKP